MGRGRRRLAEEEKAGAKKFLKNTHGYFGLLPLSAGCTSNNSGCT